MYTLNALYQHLVGQGTLARWASQPIVIAGTAGFENPEERFYGILETMVADKGVLHDYFLAKYASAFF